MHGMAWHVMTSDGRFPQRAGPLNHATPWHSLSSSPALAPLPSYFLQQVSRYSDVTLALHLECPHFGGAPAHAVRVYPYFEGPEPMWGVCSPDIQASVAALVRQNITPHQTLHNNGTAAHADADAHLCPCSREGRLPLHHMARLPSPAVQENSNRKGFLNFIKGCTPHCRPACKPQLTPV